MVWILTTFLALRLIYHKARLSAEHPVDAYIKISILIYFPIENQKTETRNGEILCFAKNYFKKV